MEEEIQGISLDDLTAITETPASVAAAAPTEVQRQFLRELEITKRGRQLAIPTDDLVVKRWLRKVTEPITLFAEGPYDRRERLRKILASTPSAHRELLASLDDYGEVASTVAVADSEEFFVPGPSDLIKLRKWLVEWSLPRAQERLQREQSFYYDKSVEQLKQQREILAKRVAKYTLVGSQIGGERQLAAVVAIDTSMRKLAVTGDFGGQVKLWDPKDLSLIATLRGVHLSRITSLASSSTNLLATADIDGTLALWGNGADGDFNYSPSLLAGHHSRIGAVAFHPSGRLLGSAGYDQSWRLWDVENIKEVQIQEGHSRAVTSLAFHPDGALAITGGLDAHGRVWDLRLGRAIWTLQGHQKAILSIACHPLRPLLATAGEEGIVCIWDLRNLRLLYQLPAHPSVISSIAYNQDFIDENIGELLASSGYDGSVRLWSTADYRPLCPPLQMHEGKVMGAVFLADLGIISIGQDRTLKIWNYTG